jgi:glutamate synthase (NADPH/NADH) small chain
VEIGKDISAKRLAEQFDAVVLCCGSTIPRDLNAEGRNLAGIHFAMEYLKAATLSLNGGTDSLSRMPAITAKDKDVIVIGGGDTGTDCVGTAIRQGCRSVVQFELLPKPPESRTPDNPWPEWPKVLKVDYGQEEASEIFGSDPREYCISTEAFCGNEKGGVSSVKTYNIEWKRNEKGQYTPNRIPGTDRKWNAQLVLLAMGFLGPEKNIIDDFGVAVDERSNVKTKPGSYATNIKGVFSAGDMRRGQSLVVWAIQEGRGAAAECDRYLMG